MINHKEKCKYSVLSAVLCISFWIFYNQIWSTPKFASDLPAHIEFARGYFHGTVGMAHPGFHVLIYGLSKLFSISLEWSSVILLSLTKVCTVYVFIRIFQHHLISPTMVWWLALAMFVISPIYIPFFNKFIYLGQGSASTWHNPTSLPLIPIALITTLLIVPLMRVNKIKFKECLCISAILAASTILKPNFVLSFIPALSMYVLLYYRKNHVAWIKALVAISPTLLLLTWQLFEYDKMPNAGKMIFDFLGVWKLYSPNPLISIVISTAFPLLILLFRGKLILKNHFLILSWLGLIVSFLISAFFAESGASYSAGNFMWGINIFLPPVFVFSLIEFASWLKEKKEMGFYVAAFVLILHVISGIWYLVKIMRGGVFW